MKEIYPVKVAMAGLGFELIDQTYGSMDSGSAVFRKNCQEIRISKDRGIWEHEGKGSCHKRADFHGGYTITKEFIKDLMILATHTDT